MVSSEKNESVAKVRGPNKVGPHDLDWYRRAAASTQYNTIYMRCYFNVRSKADMSQLNLPHGTDN